MADVAVLKTAPAPEAIAYERTEAIPWHLWAGLLAATCAVVGGQWDISWHRTIGRDTFWTPAHILIYLCGVIAGFSSAAVVLSNTFGQAGNRAAATVRLWGFRAPLGSFMCIWGAVAMIASAPFDDWWHNAYGLDVKILSPPHAVLAAGLGAIVIGARLQVLGEMNRATGRRRRLLEWMFLYSSVMLFQILLTLIMEYTFRNNMHRAQFYRVTAGVSMLVLPGVARACGRRWSASMVAAGYSLFLILLNLILPLFPAEPKLGPVFQQVKFFIPPEFPLLVFFPALVLDWLLRRYQSMNKWALSALAGAAFFVVFAAVQWPFANFLMSPWSRNWFFGTHYLPYFARPEGFYARYIFFETEPLGSFFLGMGSGLLWTILATRFSIGGGDWMKTIQR
jgi:hypothetical protein